MKEIILVKVGELALKGLNKHTFEDILVRNMRRSLKPLGECKIQTAQSKSNSYGITRGAAYFQKGGDR